MRKWLVILGTIAVLLSGATGNATAEDICFGSGDPAAPIFRLDASSVAHTSVGDVFSLLGFFGSSRQKEAVTGTLFLEDSDHMQLRLTIQEGSQQCDAQLVANHFPYGDTWTGACTGTLVVSPIEIVDCVTGGVRIIP
jgi:hypothetical protein